MLHILKNIFIALLLGIFCTLIYLQYDLQVHNGMQQKFKNAFEQLFDCSCSCSIGTLNIFSPTLTLKNMHVRSKDSAKPWHWHADTYTMQFSWWHLLLHGSLNLGIRITNPRVESEFQHGTLTIAGHIHKMMRGTPSIPIIIKHITIGPIHCTLYDPKKEHLLELELDSKTKTTHGILQTLITLKNGIYRKAGQTFIHSLQTQLLIKSAPFLRVTLAKECSCVIENITNKPIACSIQGSWYKGCAEFSVTTTDNVISIDKLNITKKDGGLAVDMHGSSSFAFLQECAAQWCTLKPQPISGATHFDLHMQTAAHNPIPRITGSVTFNKIQYKDQPIADACLQFEHNKKYWCGTLQLTSPAQSDSIHGSWSFDANAHNGSCNLHIDKPIALTPTCILTQADLNMHLNSAQKPEYTGSVAATLQYADNIVHADAQVNGTDMHCAISGSCADVQYRITATRDNVWQVNALCTDQSAQPIVQCSYDQATLACKGFIDVACMQKCIEPYCNLYQGAGQLNFNLSCKDSSALQGSFTFDGIIRPAHLYNCIANIDGILDINLLHKKCALSAHAQCTYGTVTAHCFAQWNNAYQLEFLKAPCSFNNYQLCLDQHIQVAISGDMLITADKDQTPAVSGHLIVDSAHIKHTLLTPTFFKKLLHASQTNMPAMPLLTCSMNIETKAPITLNTDVMQTHAKVNLHLHNTTHNPMLVGTIELLDGSIHFPYKPLFIHKGMLTFLNDLHNPFIELVAKNSIKQHDITLSLHGTINDYALSLYANPPLDDNQIVSLLFMGFPEQSLKPLIPALVTNQVKNWLFGSCFQNPTSAWQMIPYFLRRVHLVPLFTDPTARGGIRAAFEIELADRIRALIQKNFTLTEDTRFELEYQLSDNITLRGVRDERRDVNGQVEMRWKF